MRSNLAVAFTFLVVVVKSWVVDKRSVEPTAVVQGDAIIVVPPPGDHAPPTRGLNTLTRGLPTPREGGIGRPVLAVPSRMAARKATQQHQRYTDNEPLYKQMKQSVRRSVGFPSNSNYTCKNFLKIENSVSLKGEVLVNLQDYSPEKCKKRCLEETQFACLAAFIQHPDNCFLSGFYIRPDPHSDHYYRTCDHGSRCFIKQENHSSGTHQINKVIIPWYLPEIKYTYCMALCEQMASCVGFDIVDNPPRCVFQDLQRYTDYSFDMFLRQC